MTTIPTLYRLSFNCEFFADNLSYFICLQRRDSEAFNGFCKYTCKQKYRIDKEMKQRIKSASRTKIKTIRRQSIKYPSGSIQK